MNWTYFPLHLTSFSMAVHWFFWTIVRSFWCFLRKLSSSFWCFLVSFIKLFSFFTTSGVMGSNFISSERKKDKIIRLFKSFKKFNCNSIICLLNLGAVHKLCCLKILHTSQHFAVICMHLCLCKTHSQDCPHGEIR